MKRLRAVLGKKGQAEPAQPPYNPAPSAFGQQPMAHSDYNAGSVRAADLTVGDYANGIPNIRLGAMFGSFLRQFVWIIPMLIVGAVAAWFLTSDFKRSYTGEGSILVQIGDEYVYQPVAGTGSAAGLMQTPDTIALNEIAIIKNPEVMDRVIGEIASMPGGLSAFAPEIAEKLSREREGSTGYQLAYMELRQMMNNSFMVAHRPKSSVIDMAYKHENPHLSVSTLNRLMDAYMSYRRTVFVEGAGDVILQRRQDTEEQLAANERRISAFLRKNNISDFDSEQAGASKRTEDLKATLNTLRGDIAQSERSLAVTEDQLRQTDPSINLYVDDRLSNRLAQAELERQQLLAKYLPTSKPVQDKDREISELKRLQQTNAGQAAGGRRVGPNPVYQALITQRNTLQATANSLREKEFTLQRQLNSVDEKLRKMTALSPEYRDLLRSRETLNDRLKNYLVKEQEALINQQQAEASSENVRVLARATYPIKGRNMRLVAFAGAVLAWGFTLVMFALFRVFSDPKLYATPQSASQASSMSEYAPAPSTDYAPEYAPNSTPAYEPAYQPAYSPDVQPQPAQAYPAQAYYDPSAYDNAGYANPVGEDPVVYVPAEQMNGYGYGGPAQGHDPYAAPHYAPNPNAGYAPHPQTGQWAAQAGAPQQPPQNEPTYEADNPYSAGYRASA